MCCQSVNVRQSHWRVWSRVLTSDQMDDKWFKQQQRRAGVTSEDIAAILGRDRSAVSRILTGRQAMSIEWAEAFAQALGSDLATVLEKAGVTNAPSARTLEPGYRESDVVPFSPEGQADRKTTATADALGARPGVGIWRCKGTAMAQAGILAGDYLLVDTNASERTGTDDIVVAQVYSPSGAKTVLRRHAPPVLVASTNPGETEPVHVVDGINVVIRGKVIAVWRTR